MTNATRTHVVLVLDETGSMEAVRAETVGGLKEWLMGLKTDLPAESPLTFVRFNSNAITQTLAGLRLGAVEKSVFDDYEPNYSTPLYDAVGQTIIETERRVAEGDGVIFTVMTDGHENASKEFTAAQVRALIERLKAAGWKFMFLGADIDAYDAGARLGFAASDTVSMKKGRMREAFAAQNAKARDYHGIRQSHSNLEAAERTQYTDAERREMGEERLD